MASYQIAKMNLGPSATRLPLPGPALAQARASGAEP